MIKSERIQRAVIGGWDIGTVTLVLRCPNSLGITDIRDCIFYDEFKQFEGANINQETKIEIKMLKERIRHYVEENKLYVHSPPFDCIPMIEIR